ncbi:hypothetical protein LINPERHAP1_LOCUS5705 [Linum perenne]
MIQIWKFPSPPLEAPRKKKAKAEKNFRGALKQLITLSFLSGGASCFSFNRPATGASIWIGSIRLSPSYSCSHELDLSGSLTLLKLSAEDLRESYELDLSDSSIQHLLSNLLMN